MASITTRAGKGSPLTNAEVDSNFNNINAELATAAITGGNINNAVIGNTTPAAGNFTTVDTTNIEVTNIKAKDGTAAGSIADSTGVVTLASSVLTTTDINGGTIDGTAIGGASAAAGAFTTLNTSGAVVFNDAGADVDFRVEGDTDANLLFVDASADKVGIGTNTPSGKFNTLSTDNLTSNGSLVGRRSFSISPDIGDVKVQAELITGTNGSANSPDFYVTAIGWNSLAGAQNVGFRMRTQGGTYNSPTAGQTGQFVTVLEASHVTAATVSYEQKMQFAAAFTSFSLGGSERMRIDSSGNVGIGVTPSSWGTASNLKALQLPGVSLFGFNDANLYLVANAYFDGTNWKYVGAGFATEYENVSGNHIWYNAPSGTAGNTITFTERARITSDGFFKASNNGTYNDSIGNYHELNSTTNNDNVLYVVNRSASPYGIINRFPNATPNNTTNYFFLCDDSTNQKAAIYSSGTFASRSNVYGAFSDIKLKQDVVDASSQWDDIKALRIVKYRLKDEVAINPDYPAYIGVIAQEVEQVSAGLIDNCADFENVTKTREVEKTREVTPAVLDEEGNEIEPAITETYTETEEYTEREATGTVTKSVKSSILYMKAVKALQEAMERIETLEAKNDALEARLSALEQA
jgi:hypothetical protein